MYECVADIHLTHWGFNGMVEFKGEIYKGIFSEKPF